MPLVAALARLADRQALLADHLEDRAATPRRKPHLPAQGTLEAEDL
jgi:hypothetical protein